MSVAGLRTYFPTSFPATLSLFEQQKARLLQEMDAAWQKAQAFSVAIALDMPVTLRIACLENLHKLLIDFSELTKNASTQEELPFPDAVKKGQFDPFILLHLQLFCLPEIMNSWVQEENNPYRFQFLTEPDGSWKLQICNRNGKVTQTIAIRIKGMDFVACFEEGGEQEISSASQNLFGYLTSLASFIQKQFHNKFCVIALRTQALSTNNLFAHTTSALIQAQLGNEYISLEEFAKMEIEEELVELETFTQEMQKREEECLEIRREKPLEELAILRSKVDGFIASVAQDVDSSALANFKQNVELLFVREEEKVCSFTSYREDVACFPRNIPQIEEWVFYLFQMQLIPTFMDLWLHDLEIPVDYHIQTLKDGSWNLFITKQGIIVRSIQLQLNLLDLVASEADPLTQQVSVEDIGGRQNAYEQSLALGRFIYRIMNEEPVEEEDRIISIDRMARLAQKVEALQQRIMQIKTDIVDDTLSLSVKANLRVLIETKWSHVPSFNFLASNTMTDGGINLCIDHLNQKYNGEINCWVCNELEDFSEGLDTLKSSDFNGKIAFIVRSAESKDTSLIFKRTTHVTAILIEKYGEAMKMCVMDSVGDRVAPSEDPAEPSPNYLQNILDAAKNHLPLGTIIYISPFLRQYSSSNCVSFALNDVEHFFTSSDNLFEVLDREGQLVDNSHLNAFIIGRLPPEYMELGQNLLVVDRYIKENSQMPKVQDLAESVRNHKRLKFIDFNEETGLRTINSAGKVINMMARHKLIGHYAHLSDALATNSLNELLAFSSCHNVVYLNDRLAQEPAIA